MSNAIDGKAASSHTHTNSDILKGTSQSFWEAFQGQYLLANSSDIRYKENIDILDQSYLDKISTLQSIKYDWNQFMSNNSLLQNRYGIKNLGFSAHDLEEIGPEAVQEITFLNKQIKVINNVALFAVLIRCIQELKSKNDDLEEKVDLIAQHLELAI